MSFLEVAGVVVQPTLEVVKNKWKYFWNCDKCINKLEDECRDLRTQREGLNRVVEEAIDNAMHIESEVIEWLRKVDKVIEDASALIEKKFIINPKEASTEDADKVTEDADKVAEDASAPIDKKKFIINPYERYKIGRKADDAIREIKELQTKRSQFVRIDYRCAPGKVTGLYKGISYHVTSSRAEMLLQINRYLMDPYVKAVGVFGASGVGKSTLLTQVVEQVHSRSLGYDFHEVAMATVSQDLNFEKIQNDLAYGLGLKFENENGVQQKAKRLIERLNQGGKNILIILDDIWKKLDLEKLGLDQRQCRFKLLLTSRSGDTLMNEMDCRKNLELKPLSKEEAVELFWKILGRQIKDESISELVGREVVGECACLPVYIVPLATQLEKYGLSAWRSVLEKRRESSMIEKNRLVEEALKKEEAKKLFLLCGKIGTQIIAIEDLLFYGWGLGLLKGKTIEEGREKLKSLVENLKSFCLLEDYRADYIKMHDVMSEIALSMASEDSLVLRDRQQLENYLESKESLKNCNSISLPFVDEIPEELLKASECSKLTMFLSYNNANSHIKLSDLFFEKMKELKVLDIYGASFSGLPSSIKHSTGLQTLCLDQCKIDNLKEVGKLKTLEVLTLRGSEVNALPKEVGELTNLRLLDLRRCFLLKKIESGALEKLIKLEELYLPQSYVIWKTEGHANATLDELTGMSCLQRICICIPDFSIVPHGFPFGNLVTFKIVVRVQGTMVGSFDESDRGKLTGKMTPKDSSLWTATNYLMEYDKEKTLRLKLAPNYRNIILEKWFQTALYGARKLDLMCWIDNESTITDLSRYGFAELKDVSVQYSPGVKYIFRPKDGFSSSTLESLFLNKLINLEKIYQGNLLASSLTKLKILKIKACQNLEALFPLSLAKGLLRIEEIEVSDCKKLTNIVAFSEVGGDVEFKRSIDGSKCELLELKRLRKLTLSNLPQISGFCSGEIKADVKNDDGSTLGFLDGRQVSFPSLESLSLSKLPKISAPHGKYPMKLCRLRLLEVKGCKKVLNVVEKGLQDKNLEELVVENCKSIKTIFHLEKSSTGKGVKDQVQKKPMKLKLVDLAKLKTIWPMNIKKSYLVHNLNELEVSKCHHLTHLFSSSMAKSLQNISKVIVDDCEKLDVIFKEEIDYDGNRGIVRFSSLKELRISKTENLTAFASGVCSFDFPRLSKLEIKGAAKMSTFLKDGSSSSKENSVPYSCFGLTKARGSWLRIAMSTRNEDNDEDKDGDEDNDEDEDLNLKPRSAMSRTDEDNDGDKDEAGGDGDKDEDGGEDDDGGEDNYGDNDGGEDNDGDKDGGEGNDGDIDEEEDSDKAHYQSFFSAKVILPSLEKLVLSSLGDFKSIWQNTPSEDSFGKLMSIEIEKCSHLRKFSSALENQENAVVMEESAEKLVLGFPYLTNLKVSGCEKLGYLFSDATARTLFELENLHVSSCRNMSTIVSTQEEGMIKFHKLHSLTLSKLQSLGSFSTGSAQHHFPYLEELSISECKNLERFIKRQTNSSIDVNAIPLFDCKVVIPRLEKLYLEEVGLEEIVRNEFPEGLFSQLKLLEVKNCDKLSTVLPCSILSNLLSLESLMVDSCMAVKIIFEFRGYNLGDRKLKAGKSWKLKTIKLTSLESLEYICGNEFFPEYFPFNELNLLEVRNCKLLRSIFTVSIVNILEKLQKLDIADCESMNQVIKWSPADCSKKGNSKIIFHQLSLLTLSELSKLGSFCSGCMTDWPSLEKMEIKGCECVEAFVADSESYHGPKLGCSCKRLPMDSPSGEKMEIEVSESEKAVTADSESEKAVAADSECYCGRLFVLEKVAFPKMESLSISFMSNMKELWNVSKEGDFECSSEAFPQLKALEISNCSKITTIFPSKMIREFRKLEDLKVHRCESLKQVLQLQGLRSETKSIDNNSADTISFSLRNLELGLLEALDHVWDIEDGEGIDLSFEELHDINVTTCPSLDYLFPASIVRSLSKLVEIRIYGCDSMVEIVKRKGGSTRECCDEGNNPHIVTFPKVRVLMLHGLKSFITCTCSQFLEWPSLRYLLLVGCPKAKIPSNRCNVASIQKVDIPSNLNQCGVDMDSLQKMQSLDSFVNVADLCIYGIHETEAQRFPWKLLEHFQSLKSLGISISSFELFPLKDEVEGHAKMEEEEIAPYRCSNDQNQVHKDFQSLRELSLTALKKLKQVYREASVMEEILHRAEKLSVSFCGSLNYLFATSGSFDNLAMIDIFSCEEMKYLLTSSAAKCLSQLTVLHIFGCGKMEEIVGQDHDENGNGGANKLVDAKICFPQLKELRLECLRQLKSFCSYGSYSFEFCSLESVVLCDLPKLEVFCKGGCTAPLLHDIEQYGLKTLMEFDD